MLRLLTGLIAAWLMTSGASQAQQNWPSRPITFIVPYPAGVVMDITARTYADGLKAILGQPVIVENKAGAGTLIALRAAAGAKPDGYTIMIAGATTVATASVLFSNPAYKVEDFESVAVTGVSNLLLSINADIPAKTLPEFIALAKANPKKYSFITAGTGGIGHLAAALFIDKAKIDLLHVPYVNMNNGTIDQAAGRVHMQLSTILQQAPFIQSGQLRALAVSVSKRLPDYPNVPTMQEGGVPDYDIRTVMGILVPAGTPKDIIEKLNKGFNAISADSKAEAEMAKMGLTQEIASPDAFMRAIAGDSARFTPVIKELGIKAD